MTTVFLSYSTDDHIFAELAVTKLKQHGIELWQDRGQIRAGDNWRNAIDHAIAGSHAVLVALSEASAESSYVTYEWAYAIGKGKPIIPIRLQACDIHPRLQVTQYLDFSMPGNLPWGMLVDRVREIEADQNAVVQNVESVALEASENPNVNAILQYLDRRGYQMASFERLRSRVNQDLSDEQFSQIIRDNPQTFRSATLRGDKPGIAKLVP